MVYRQKKVILHTSDMQVPVVGEERYKSYVNPSGSFKRIRFLWLQCIDCKEFRWVGKFRQRSRCHLCSNRYMHELAINKKSEHIVLTDAQNQVLDGLLLGDGNVSRGNRSKNSVYAHSSSKPETVETLSHLLPFESSITRRVVKEHFIKRQSGNCLFRETISYDLRTTCYPQLNSFRNRWYPNGIKIVPKDIRLTPITCYWWYIGDGTLHKRIRNGKLETTELVLCTNGFVYADLLFLIGKMKLDVGIEFVVIRHDGSLKISSYDVDRFLRFIGNCNNMEYAYKWEYVRPKNYRRRQRVVTKLGRRGENKHGMYHQFLMLDKLCGERLCRGCNILKLLSSFSLSQCRDCVSRYHRNRYEMMMHDE